MAMSLSTTSKMARGVARQSNAASALAGRVPMSPELVSAMPECAPWAHRPFGAESARVGPLHSRIVHVGTASARKCTGALGQFLANTDSLSRLSGSSTKSRWPTSWSRCVQKLPGMSISLLHALADVQLPMTIEGECVDEVLILAMAGHLVAEVAAPVRTPMGWRNPSANVRAITHLGWRMLRVSSSPSRWKSIPTRSRRCGPKAIGIGTGTLVAAAASVEFLQRALASTP